MIKSINRIITTFSEHPKKLFLLDSIGALVTAILIGIVLRQLSTHIGLSKNILLQLSAVAILFTIYSFSCYLFLNKIKPVFLQLIAFANTIYCCLTLFIIFFHSQTVQPLGFAYFLLEIAILLILIYIELSVANRLKLKRIQ